jgi:hypothetical protein
VAKRAPAVVHPFELDWIPTLCYDGVYTSCKYVFVVDLKGY